MNRSVEHTFRNPAFLASLVVGLLMLVASLASVYVSTTYANQSASNYVTDIILSNTRVYEVDGIFVYGAMAAVLFSVIVLLFFKLRYFPFALKSVSVFLAIRSVFVSLTHISPYPQRIAISETFLSSYRFFQLVFTSDDLFFSVHTGLPFLMTLIFWENRFLRYLYLVISVGFAVVVLLGHLHYSIDVFAAYFITYSIYVLTVRVFKTDYARTHA